MMTSLLWGAAGILATLLFFLFVEVIFQFLTHIRRWIMAKRKTELYALPCRVRGSTGTAIRVEVNGTLHYIPMSQVMSINDAKSSVVMTAWMAKKKGFIS